MQKIQFNKPLLGAEEIKAVTSVIESGWIIGGKVKKRFEDEIKKLVNAKFAVAVTSGHAALHLCLVILSINPGDEVIVPSYTVSDLLNAIYYVRAKPVLTDIEDVGFSIDPIDVRKKITKKTRAIIVPHMFGMPAKIHQIASYGIPIVEDSAQALGSTYMKKNVGTYGDLNVFSFYASKIITTGQGGMITTNNQKYDKILRDLLNYNSPKQYKVRYNYPMTDIAAAIGREQLEKLPKFIARRKKIALKYSETLDGKGLIYYPKRNDTESNYFRFILEFPSEIERNKAKEFFKKNNIDTIVPLKTYEVLHNLLGEPAKLFPNSQKRSETTLALPVYPTLYPETVDYIVRIISEIL